ncbi:twin-arginine translocation signal domain-containing protein [Altererythrobacter aurantiacus]|uniref:Carbonic anhydrase n=1 Tax=Parapontixanthobacter aurantiacus TaxID=1463599 RepID=A0A844Z781_9SPHN|nr:carbonic anhydrase [Parapontixanthobacter aurantiacus]MXO84491.1 twin-arginine translocation signal domain-containing protein [Parapontixanthobacter aurantiacus]
MISRRNVLAGAAVAGGTLGVSNVAAAQAPQPARLAPVVDGKTALSPDEALELLIEGNRNFLNDVPTAAPVGRERRLEIAQGQAPFAAYVTCSDSRVSPEILFGRGLGELFIIRNAGNTVDTVALGSIEYAVAELGVPLIVVMGHESCGAVKAAKAVVDENATFPGSIGRMVEPIIPAVLEVRGSEGNMLDNAIRANVSRVATQLRTSTDPLLLEPQEAGKLKVVGAYYNLDSGAVDFFDRP